MKIEELLENKDFQSEILNSQSLDEVVEILRSRGIDITENQLRAYFSEEGELSEVELDNVAGGRGLLDRLGRLANSWFSRYLNNLIRTTRGGF